MDAEIGAARLGSRRILALGERYGIDTLEAAFPQILKNTAEIFREEILPKIADGVYTSRTTSRPTVSTRRDFTRST